MNIREHLSEGELTLSLSGTFDESTCSSVEKRVDELLERDVKTISFDMENVGYISSAGIRVLILAYKRATKWGKKVTLGKMSSKVRDIIESVGIMPLFTKQ